MQTASPVALVTGASSGIGRAAALALVDAGFAVVGTSRNAASAAPLAGVTFLDLDVAGDESSINQTKEVFDINLFGLMRMTNAVLPYMRAQGSGRVVNVSSVLGLI